MNILAQLMPLPIPVPVSGNGNCNSTVTITVWEILIGVCILLLIIALAIKGMDYLIHSDFYSVDLIKGLGRDKEKLKWKMDKHGTIHTKYNGNKIKLKECFVYIGSDSYMIGINSRGLRGFYRKFKNDYYNNKYKEKANE